jgi:hypothetical protein
MSCEPKKNKVAEQGLEVLAIVNATFQTWRRRACRQILLVQTELSMQNLSTFQQENVFCRVLAVPAGLRLGSPVQ